MSHNIFRLAAFGTIALSLFGCNLNNNAATSNGATTVTIDGNSYNVEVSSLVVGMECDYAPWNWTEASSGDYSMKISNSSGYADGYDVQIAKQLGETLGMEVKIYKQLWESLISDVQSDTINLVIAGMTDTEDRRQSIDFTDEYYRSEVVLLCASSVASQYEGKTLTSTDLSSLFNGKIVISQKNTVEDDMAENFSKDYTNCTHGAANETYGGAAVDVQNGIADFLVVELPVAQAYAKSMGNVGIIHIDQSVLGVDLSQLGVSIGVKKGNDGLKAALNAALAKIDQTTRNSLMSAAVERSGE